MNFLRTLITVALTAGAGLAQPGKQDTGKIAFLRHDAVWIAGLNGTGAVRATEKGVTVDGFLFSPGGKYLAFSAVVGSAEEPGIWDSSETPPERPICSIIVLDQGSKQTMFRTDSAWFSIARWLPGERLLFYDSDGFAVNNHYEFNPATGEVKTMEVPDDRLIDSEFGRDGTLEAYAGDDGRSLHIFDRSSGRDTVIATTRGMISESRFSSDGGRLVYMEVQSSGGAYTDVLWLLDRTTGAARALDRRPARPKFRGEDHLAWSPGDRRIGMFYPPGAIVMDLGDPGKTWTIPGRDFSWISDEMLLVSRDEGIFRYDLESRTEQLMLPDATKGIVLR